MLLALILAASSPTNTVGRFDRTNSRTPQGRSCRGMLGGNCLQCTCANSTNYILRSQEFENAAWAVNGAASVTNTDGTSTFWAPDGTNNARLLTVAACAGVEAVIYQVQPIPGGTNTGSVWVRRGSGNISVSLYSSGDGVATAALCTPVADAWIQCTVTQATVSNVYLTIGCNDSGAYTGHSNTGAATAYLWQGQMEPGSVATCPIKTTTTTATRTGACEAVCR